MMVEDYIVIKKFEELFGGSLFVEEPGEQWIYEKDGQCYSLPDTFLNLLKKSIEDNKNHLIFETQNKVRYYLEDTPFKPKDWQRLMRFQDGELPEEYDFKSKRWKINTELSQIYYGGIEVDTITEAKAIEIINTRNNKI